jgi:hypothetical protein
MHLAVGKLVYNYSIENSRVNRRRHSADKAARHSLLMYGEEFARTSLSGLGGIYDWF